MEEMVRQYAAPVAVALVVGYLSRYVQPRSRVVHWFPAAFRFDLPLPQQQGQQQQYLTIWTHALTIQNLGWRTASKVEIIHRAAPQHFQIHPGVKFTTTTNPTGEHVIEIDSLGRREVLTVQMLGAVNQPPPLVGVKSADGPARRVATRQTFVISRPRQWLFLILIVIGFVAAFSWVARAGARLLTVLQQVA